MSFLALLMALVAASSTSAGDHAHYGHANYDHTGNAAGHGAWNTGCCDQPNSCCQGWWDNYCAEKKCCSIKEKFAQYRSQVICNPAPTGCGAGCGGCGSCASAPCRHVHLPKLELPCLPCLQMPSLSLPHTNCGTCRGIGCGGCGDCGGCGSGLTLPSFSLPCFDLHSWRRPKACHGGCANNCSSCGAPAADCGCGHSGAVDYNYAPEHGEMMHSAPMPPAYQEPSPVPADMREAPIQTDGANSEDNSDRSATLDAIRNYTLLP